MRIDRMADGPSATHPAPATSAQGRADEPWLSVVGIGEGGVADLSPRAVAAIAKAELVFGGHRHIALAASVTNGRAILWPTPFDVEMTAVRAARGRKTCVLASGDPSLFGVGATLARHVPPEEMVVLPSPSAFSLAAARLGWPLGEVETISLHGRARDRLRPLLHPGARILALTSDADDPIQIAALLSEAGFGTSALTLMEALGGLRERVRHVRADSFDLEAIDPLNLLAIEVADGTEARIIPLSNGRPDELFDHDGQITKREIRAVTLSMLSPRRCELLWDIGAGSGSIGIEWMLAHPSMRAVALEPRSDRSEKIGRNAVLMGVPGLSIVTGSAPDALQGLPQPDAVFVGGGATVPGVVTAAIDALRSGGRVVINAVTLETEAILLDHHARLGGSLTRIAVSRADPVGTMTGWRSAMPVTIWSWTKP
jgi:precorrin-6Y C5,15-methyltransferase (decarboxylating)